MLLIRFFKSNFLSIIILSLLILFLLVIFSIFNNKFSEINGSSSKKDIDKVVTIETMDSFDGAFCKKYKHKHEELEEQCNKLHKKECTSIGCCVLRNGTDCVAGSKQGPIYHGTEDNPINIDFYHFKNRCYKGKGECPDSEQIIENKF